MADSSKKSKRVVSTPGKKRSRSSIRVLLAAEKKRRKVNEDLVAAGGEIVPEYVEIDDENEDVGEPLSINYVVDEPVEDSDYDDERTIASLLSLKEASPSESDIPKKKAAKKDKNLMTVNVAMRVKTKVKRDGSHKLSRHAPILLKNIIKKLKKEQVDWVCSTGLGSLLHFQMEEYDHNLLYQIGLNYNADEPCIMLPCGRLPVRPRDVKKLLGLPHGPNPIPFSSNSEYTENERIVAAAFPKAASLSRIGLLDMIDSLYQIRDVSSLFKLIFLVIVNNFLIQKNSNMYASQTFLKFSGDLDALNNYDFCSYLLSTLSLEKLKWAKGPSTKYFNGSLPFLTLLYVDRTYLIGAPPTRSTLHPLQRWTHEELTLRLEDEHNRGDFGSDVALVKKRLKLRKIKEKHATDVHKEIDTTNSGIQYDNNKNTDNALHMVVYQKKVS